MSDYRDFLEAQVRDSEGRLERASEAIRAALGALDASLDDVATWRKALEKYTRDSDTPYRADPVSSPLDTLLQGRAVKAEPVESQRERPKREERPPAPKKFSKRGAVRDYILSLDHREDIGEVFAGLSKKELQEKITKTDLYKILPSLYASEEISRVGSKYGPPDFEDREPRGNFFEGVKEPVM